MQVSSSSSKTTLSGKTFQLNKPKKVREQLCGMMRLRTFATEKFFWLSPRKCQKEGWNKRFNRRRRLRRHEAWKVDMWNMRSKLIRERLLKRFKILAGIWKVQLLLRSYRMSEQNPWNKILTNEAFFPWKYNSALIFCIINRTRQTLVDMELNGRKEKTPGTFVQNDIFFLYVAKTVNHESLNMCSTDIKMRPNIFSEWKSITQNILSSFF